MIDLHCHLDLYEDPEAIIRECVARGVYVLSVTTTPLAWERTHALVKNAPRIRTAVGIHPEIAHTAHADLDLFESLLAKTRYVGEIGLDASPSCIQTLARQVEVFDGVLAMCERAGGKILSIHSRRAVPGVLDAIAKRPSAGAPILHWFSGTRSQLDRAVRQGCWFSVGPAMFLSQKGQDLIASMPQDRILPESDGPFVRVGDRPASPNDMEAVLAGLAAIWKVPVAVAMNMCRENFRQLVI